MKKLLVFTLTFFSLVAFSASELKLDSGIFGTNLAVGVGTATSTLDVLGGSFYLPGPNAAPADANFDNSQWSLWLDETSDEFELKARKSNGVIITQTVGAGGGGSGTIESINFNLTGPFNTTFERIDGFRQMDGAKTITNCRLTIFDSGTSGTTTVTVRRDGPSGTASFACSVAANAGATDTSSTAVSMTLAAGDYIWADVTAVAAGTVEDLSVDLYE